MSSQEFSNATSKELLSRYKPYVKDYRKEFPALNRLGYIGKSMDVEKYTYALDELKKYFEKEGYKEIAGLFQPLSNYNIVIVPYNYKWKSEELLAKIISRVKGWGSVSIKKLTQLLMDNAELLNKLGHPITQIAYLLENETVKTKITTVTSNEAHVNGSLGVPVAGVSAGVREKGERIVSQELEGSIDTVRTVVSMLLDNVSKPTLLILRDNELEILGADTILNAVVANRNLTVLVFLPNSPST